MSIPALSPSKPSINFGHVVKIEVRQQGTGSLQDVGSFSGCTGSVTSLSQECDPAGSQQVYAHEYQISFSLIQTGKTTELAAFMAGVAATGFLETDAELKLTFIGGRTLTLGSATGYPLRLVAVYNLGDASTAQSIDCTGTVLEPITALSGKVA